MEGSCLPSSQTLLPGCTRARKNKPSHSCSYHPSRPMPTACIKATPTSSERKNCKRLAGRGGQRLCATRAASEHTVQWSSVQPSPELGQSGKGGTLPLHSFYKVRQMVSQGALRGPQKVQKQSKAPQPQTGALPPSQTP